MKGLCEMASTVLRWGKETQTAFPCPKPPSRLTSHQSVDDVNNLSHHY